MSEQPLTAEECQRKRGIETFADTMFCKMAIAVLFGELAKLQPNSGAAVDFLRSQKLTLKGFLERSSPAQKEEWDLIFEDRFKDNMEVVFNSISIGNENK